MQNIKMLLFGALLIMIFPALAQKEMAPAKKFIHLDKSDTLPYRLIQPLEILPRETYPLVIFLHGAGERGNDNERHLKHVHGLFSVSTLKKYPCFVVAPQCPRGQSWSDYMAGKAFSPRPTRPTELFLQILEKILKEYPVDPTRIYITGVSMGGFGTWDLLARYPEKFAAAVPICGGGDEKTAPKIKHIPIWAFHGALDDVVPPERSRVMVAALHAAGGLPGYTEYPDVEHNSWIDAYKEPRLMRWLFKQKLAGGGSK